MYASKKNTSTSTSPRYWANPTALPFSSTSTALLALHPAPTACRVGWPPPTLHPSNICRVLHPPPHNAPSAPTQHAPSASTQHAPSTLTQHAPSTLTQHAPSVPTQHAPSTLTQHAPSTLTQHAPSTSTYTLSPHPPTPKAHTSFSAANPRPPPHPPYRARTAPLPDQFGSNDGSNDAQWRRRQSWSEKLKQKNHEHFGNSSFRLLGEGCMSQEHFGDSSFRVLGGG